MNRWIAGTATLVRCAAAVAGLAASPAAHAQAPPPQPQQQGGIAYLNGGAGDEEVQFIKQSMKDYSLALQFGRAGTPRAEYVATVSITIKDAGGATVLEAPSVGPYLLVKLPAGTYSVVATYQDVTQTRPVTVAKTASAPVTFTWK